MKKSVLFFAIILATFSYGQSVKLENSLTADSSSTDLCISRVAVSADALTLTYDYKKFGGDVLSILIPKVISDSNSSLSAIAVKVGDGGPKDQYAFGAWVNKRWSNFSAMLEIGRITSPTGRPIDWSGTRLSSGNFTAELYFLSYHPIGEGFDEDVHYYGWVAYHPEHFFVSLGKADKQYWGFLGTKGYSEFGNFSFLNYDPETKNFWFRSQLGAGQVNQGFFSQELYLIATNYLIVPPFHFQHFSPIATKGDVSFKIDGRRTAGVSNYEAMFGKKIGADWLRVAVGLNSEYEPGQPFQMAPSFEAYKCFQGKHASFVMELRYDVLAKMTSAYLIARY